MANSNSRSRVIETKLQHLHNEVLLLAGKESSSRLAIETLTEQRESLIRFKSEYLSNDGEPFSVSIDLEDDRRVFISRLTSSINGLETHLDGLEKERTVLSRQYTEKRMEIKKWEMVLAKDNQRKIAKQEKREDEQCDEQIRFANYSKRVN